MSRSIALLNRKRKHCFVDLSENLAMHLGKRIQALMDGHKPNKISTLEMAKHCGVTPGAVSNWFSTGRISKENLVKVAEKLGIDLVSLITGDDAPRRSGVLVALSPLAMALAGDFDDAVAGMKMSDQVKVYQSAQEAIQEFLTRAPVAPSARPSGKRAQPVNQGKQRA